MSLTTILWSMVASACFTLAAIPLLVWCKRWAHVPMLLWLVSISRLVRLYLGTGRLWLAWTICSLRTFSLLPNFLWGENLNYQQITTLRQIPFLNELIPVAEGVPNPWMLVGQFSMALLVVFVADGSVSVWRRGDRRKALMVGGTIERAVFRFTQPIAEEAAS